MYPYMQYKMPYYIKYPTVLPFSSLVSCYGFIKVEHVYTYISPVQIHSGLEGDEPDQLTIFFGFC